MLFSGDLLKKLFKLSQTVWEIPDRYFVSSGMTGKTEIPDRYFVSSSVTGKTEIPARGPG